jgi:flagellar protein FlgJ
MNDPKMFVAKVVQAAKEASNSGSKFNLAVLVAQAAHESAWGKASLAAKYNNLFGIKASKSWKGKVVDLKTWEVYNGQREDITACWRVYDSFTDCIKNYAQIIALNDFYKPALNHLDNADEFLKVIAAHWATDPKYIAKVKAVGQAVEKAGGPKWQ